MGGISIVRYRTRGDAAAENQRRIEQVFTELHANTPAGLRNATFRLADGVSFVHVAVVEDDEDLFAKSTALQEFAQGLAERVAEAPTRDEATMIGSYRYLGP